MHITPKTETTTWTIRLELKQFLMDRNCLEEFISNCNAPDMGQCMYASHNKDSKRPLSRFTMTSCFSGFRTPQGSEFWDKIENDWTDLFKQH